MPLFMVELRRASDAAVLHRERHLAPARPSRPDRVVVPELTAAGVTAPHPCRARARDAGAGHVRRRRGRLLLGHHDTVWPVGSLAEMPFAVKDGRVTGPGVVST